MEFIQGIKLNLQGTWLGLRTPRLLLLGLLRFAMIMMIGHNKGGRPYENHHNHGETKEPQQ